VRSFRELKRSETMSLTERPSSAAAVCARLSALSRQLAPPSPALAVGMMPDLDGSLAGLSGTPSPPSFQ
jgi:hypothetical protein